MKICIKFFLLLVLLVSITNFSIPQVTLEWEKHFSTNINRFAEGRCITLDGNENIYTAGFSNGDYLLNKYDPSGNLVWTRSNIDSGSVNDAALGIIYSYNNIYVTGYTRQNGNTCITTIKYDTTGNLIWVKKFEGTSTEQSTIVKIGSDNEGNIVIGSSLRTVSNSLDYLTIKYDSTGNQCWFAAEGLTGRADYMRDLFIDSLGNIYLTGSSDIGTPILPFYEYLTVKYNSSGNRQWSNQYHLYLDPSSGAASITVDDSLNTVVTGRMNTTYCTIKIDQYGVTKWAKYFNITGTYDNIATSVTHDRNFNYYITGSVIFEGPPSHMSAGTIKYNCDGEITWDTVYSTTYSNNGRYIKLDNDGNIYVVGSIGTNILITKYNSSGEQIWMTSYMHSAEDLAYDFIIDNSNNIYVTGYNKIDYYNELLLLKFSQLTGITKISNKIANIFNLSQNYPNPFNPSTNIKFDIPIESFVKIVVYDGLGKEISILVNEHLSAGSYRISWNASNYPSGIYFYRLTAGDYTETKKMVLVK